MTTLARPSARAGTLLELVDKSRGCLLQACRQDDLDERFRYAQYAALRAAAAMLAGQPDSPRRGGPRSVWATLRSSVPELNEWADFFETTGRRVHLVDRGTVHITRREADDHIREAETFLGLALARLGLPIAPAVAPWLSPAGHPGAAG